MKCNSKFSVFLGLIIFSLGVGAEPFFDESEVKQIDPSGSVISSAVGSLIVQGNPGSDQSLPMTLFWCFDPTGKAGSCSRSTDVQVNLVSERLPEGNYLLKVGGAVWSERILVQEKMRTQLKLSELKVKPKGYDLKYSVFLDLSNRGNQLNVLRTEWLTANVTAIRDLCGRFSMKSASAEKICDVWQKATSPNSLENVWLQFTQKQSSRRRVLFVRTSVDKNGATQSLLDAYWEASHRIWIGTSIAGASLAVAPGVYGVRIENSSGLYDERIGVKVE